MADKPLCSIPGCGKPRLARGLCSTHYQRVNKNGYVRPYKPCSIGGCARALHANGYCVKHYKRWLKYGDPLGGSTDWGAAQAHVEAIVGGPKTDGCVIWPYSRSPQGAGQVRVKGKLALVSRIVCERLHGTPPTPKHQAAHSCGKAHLGCVNPHHLSWKTQKENEQDKHAHGTWRRGDRMHWAKLTADKVREIRRLVALGAKQSDVARALGITASHVSSVVSRRVWKWLED